MIPSIVKTFVMLLATLGPHGEPAQARTMVMPSYEACQDAMDLAVGQAIELGFKQWTVACATVEGHDVVQIPGLNELVPANPTKGK